MKNIYVRWMCLLMVLGLAMGNVEVKACNLSDYTLDSISYDSTTTNYTIFSTVCIGGGVLGAVRGADNATSTFAIGVFSQDAGLALISAAPMTLTADSTGCQFNIFSPGPSLLGSNFSVAYTPGTCATLACVNSTALCGRPHAQCYSFVHVFSDLPDSMIVLGAEGTGNPEAGCYPDSPPSERAEMVIDFTTLPVVWGGIEAKRNESSVDVYWSTLSEINTDHFDVQRSIDTKTWESMGRVPAARNSDISLSYMFEDEQPSSGLNQYRIVQYDLDGKYATSEAVSVNFGQEHSFAWDGIGPVPTDGPLNVGFTTQSDAAVQLSLFDVSGKRVLNHEVKAAFGRNEVKFDLSAMDSGVYFLRLTGASGTLSHKVIKQ